MNRAELDGVRVLWEDAPGPLSASLLFGVGARHKRFRTVGVTHLIEHLIMGSLAKSHLDRNARVDIDSTIFHATGKPEAVVDFIGAVCSAIADLSLTRMTIEAGVLTAESGSADHPAMCAALTDRYGLVGLGLLGTEGPGIEQLSTQHVTDHLRRFFVRDNAVLVLTGPPPPGLRVLLPEGVRPATLPVRASRRNPPGRITYSGPMPSISIEVATTNGIESGALARILLERMTDGLRHGLGLAYEVGYSSAHVDETRGVITFWADGRKGQLDKVAAGLWEAVRSLARGGPTVEEIAHDRAGLEDYLTDSRATQDRLEANAMRLLNGRQPRTPDEGRAEHDALTPARLQELAALSLATVLLQLPEDVDVDLTDLPVLDGEDARTGDTPLGGRTYRRRSLAWAPLSLHAVVGESGASLGYRGDTLTVLWPDVVGLGIGPHDRVLISADGTVLELCSRHLRHAEDLFSSIESPIDKALWFDLNED